MAYYKSLIVDAPDISHADFRVLHAITAYSDKDGRNAWPGEELIAEKCRMSTRNVERCIRKLKETGFVIEESRGRKGKDGKGRRSRFSVTNPNCQSDAGVTMTGQPDTSDAMTDGVNPTTQIGQPDKLDGSTRQIVTFSQDVNPTPVTGVSDPLPDPESPDSGSDPWNYLNRAPDGRGKKRPKHNQSVIDRGKVLFESDRYAPKSPPRKKTEWDNGDH